MHAAQDNVPLAGNTIIAGVEGYTSNGDFGTDFVTDPITGTRYLIETSVLNGSISRKAYAVVDTGLVPADILEASLGGVRPNICFV